jgi:hypothetical protein
VTGGGGMRKKHAVSDERAKREKLFFGGRGGIEGGRERKTALEVCGEREKEGKGGRGRGGGREGGRREGERESVCVCV